jgi:recombination protein RecT
MKELQKTGSKNLLQSDAVKQRFAEMLGKQANSFLVSVINAVNNSKGLQEAEPNTVLMAAATAATLNLPIDPNLGLAYIIPYKQKYKDENGKWGQKSVAQFQIGYKGLKQLAIRTGNFKFIHASDVREGELINNDRLTGELIFNWIQDESERNKLPIVGYVSNFGLLNGFTSPYFMTIEKVRNHANKYSQSFKNNSGVWADDFDNMALKTVLKLNLSKNAPLSIEMQTAVMADQSVINEEGKFEYVDNQNEAFDPHELADQKANERTLSFINAATTIQQLEQVEGHLTSDEQMKAYSTKMESLLKVKGNE